MSVTVRMASATDADLAISLDPAASDEDRALWLRRALAGEHGRVARLAFLMDRPAGLAVVGRFFGHPFLELIVTAPRQRRQGVASALMDAVERAHHDQKLFVSTNRSNTAMQAILEGRGYFAAGTVDHLDPGDPELFFVRLPS